MKFNKLTIKVLIVTFVFILTIGIVLFGNYLRWKKYIDVSKQSSEITPPSTKAVSKKKIKEDLIGRIRLGVEYMIRNQRKDGSFGYEFYPDSGEWSKRNNYVRQAGAFYTLSQAYCLLGEKSWLPAIGKVEKFFDSRKETLEIKNEKALLFRAFNGKFKINIIALYLLGLTELLDDNCRGNIVSNKQLANDLANTLVLFQKSDGAFQYYPFVYNSESDYNNGEAFFALVRAYQVLGNKEFLDASKKAATRMIELYPQVNVSFFAWGMQAYEEMNSISPNSRWREVVFRHTDQIIKKYPPTHYKAGVLSEGVSAAARVAKSLGNEVYYEKYWGWLKKASKYLDELQVGQSEYNPKIQEIAEGGFCNKSACQRMVVDATHHAVSGLIGITELELHPRGDFLFTP